MKSVSLSGIFPPIPTSFRKNGNLAPDEMQSNLNRLGRFDFSGFLVLGSNGELVHLSETEKKEVYKFCREVIPLNKTMIAGTGGQSTRETTALSVAAAEAGADAVLILHPHYYKGQMSDSALVAHYHEVAGQCPVPVIIYNMPSNTGMDLEANVILAVADHPNIIGLKDSGGNIAKMGSLLNRSKPGFQVVAGGAGFLIPALSMGACGGILALANIAPQLCIDILNHFTAGNLEEARKLQQSVIALNAAVTRNWGVPALKAAMDRIGLYGGPCRKPLQPLDPEKESQLAELMAGLGLINK